MRVERLIIPRKSWSVSGVTTIVAIAAITLIVMMIQKSWPFFVLVLLITGGFIGGLFWLLDRSLLNEKRKRYERNRIERKGALAEDKITVETDKTKMEIRWDLFDILGSNVTSWSGDLFRAIYGYVGPGLSIAAVASLVVGIAYII